MRAKLAAINPVSILIGGIATLVLYIVGPLSVLTLWGSYKEKTIVDRLFPDDLRVARQHPRRHASKLLQERQFKALPEPLMRHAYMAGWQGVPSLTFMRIFYDKATVKSPVLTTPIATQIRLLSNARVPDRIMQYRTRRFGIPLDYVSVIRDGRASIRAMVGGIVPLIDNRGPVVDKGLLVSWLAEVLMVPGGLLPHKKSLYELAWHPIDERSCGVTISYNGVTGSGVFTIGEDGFVHSFTTNDMVMPFPSGAVSQGWTMTYSNWYGQSGIAYPGTITYRWHLANGDDEYFTCSTPRITYW